MIKEKEAGKGKRNKKKGKKERNHKAEYATSSSLQDPSFVKNHQRAPKHRKVHQKLSLFIGVEAIGLA